MGCRGGPFQLLLGRISYTLSISATLTVINMPIRRNLDNFARPNFGHWLHPGLRFFLDISLNPLMTCIGRKVWLQIVVHEGVVVDDSELFEQRDEFFACVPCWRCIALWLFAGEIGYYFDGLCEDISLL